MYDIKNKKDIERETLKKFISNKHIGYKESLLEYTEIKEPCDVRYDGIDYQITEGDQEQIERRRSSSCGENKERIHVEIRGTSKIAEMLLCSALTKKCKKSDRDVVLLIDCSSTGNREWKDLEKELCEYLRGNLGICGTWKEIYAVFPQGNIRIFPFSYH